MLMNLPNFECELIITSKVDFYQFPLASCKVQILSSLKDPGVFFKRHQVRQDEYIISRAQASELYKKLTQKRCFYFPNQTDRSPLFPDDVVGTFSHSKDLVCTAMALKMQSRSLGIDLESLGRLNSKIMGHVISSLDITFTPDLNDDQLMTLIFSAKESFFKLLYPLVKKYFVFSDASIVSIQTNHQQVKEVDGFKVTKSGEFTIQLHKPLSVEFNPNAKYVFRGLWILFDDFILTGMELKNS